MRCRTGDLAEIIRSTCGNEGRRVVVAERYDLVRHGLYPGCANADGALAWIVQPLQLLMGFEPHKGAWGLSMDRCVFPDAWLRPIRDGLPGERMELAQDVEAPVSEGIVHG